jgi:hypothetical protein
LGSFFNVLLFVPQHNAVVTKNLNSREREVKREVKRERSRERSREREVKREVKRERERERERATWFTHINQAHPYTKYTHLHIQIHTKACIQVHPYTQRISTNKYTHKHTHTHRGKVNKKKDDTSAV